MPPAFVQSACNSYASGAQPLAYGSNNTAGNLLIACMDGGATSTSRPTISDTRTNTWFPLGIGFQSNVPSHESWAWYAIAKGGANTVTITPASGIGAFCILEYSGVNTLDQVLAQGNVSGQTTQPYGPITTLFPVELLILFGSNNGATPLAAGPWSANRATTAAQNFQTFNAVQDQFLVATGTFSGTVTVGNTTNGGELIASFNAPASGGGGGKAVTFLTQIPSLMSALGVL